MQAAAIAPDTTPAPPWREPRAAYVHVPFCAHRCGYCDFAVVAGQDHRHDLYIEAVEAEVAALLGEPRSVRTLFLGGGTPTALTALQLDRLFTALDRWLPRVGPDPEVSIESTPESLDAEKAAVLAAHGVTRVSIGVQSFRAHLLRTLERRHSADQVAPAVEAVRRHIPQISLDLIFGVPGQSLADWATDLDRALAFEPDHLATYGLTYETGTRLWKQRRRGEVLPLDEETERAMYLHAIDRLADAGFEHYEISNFARQGRSCRHNQVYWANEAYFGFGVGATRYVRGRRELNTRSLPEYLRRALAGEPAAFQSEELEPFERARETMAVQLRRSDGIDRAGFRRQTGFDLDAVAGRAVAQQVAAGYLSDEGGRVRLTREGKCVADGLVELLLR
jgi:oxygen-independent coproporphyrinogen-3 oxidase